MMRGISIPLVRRTFGFATHARQTGAIAWTSFWTIAKSPAGLVLPAVAMLLVLLVPVLVKLKGVSLLPTTAHVLSKLTAPVADNPRLPWVLIPLLIIYWAGELVWRERDAGMGEIADATPVREWVLVLGKFLGLALVLVGWMALLIAAGVLVQMRMGYFLFELGLYLRILFGLQLVDYLIFALLVLVVHAVVNQKQLGYLAALVAYGVILFPSFLGIKHHLLIYGSGPRWSYSVISGFGSSLGPWLWFKLYWAAWAVLLAVAARLLWPRGTERSVRSRVHLARRRLTRPVAAVAATAVTLILSVGGFIFYTTNVRQAYVTAADRMTRSAQYERQFGLAPRSASPSLDDPEARRIRVGGDPVAFEAIVGTSGDQIAVAPGALRRSWTEGPSTGSGQGGRRYFHYVTDVPIDNRWGVFSAGYAVHEEPWQGAGQAVTIQIFHHPAHAAIVNRMVAGVRASLDLYTRQLGPYPYGYLRLIESPRLMGVQTAAATVEYGEAFSLLNPGKRSAGRGYRICGGRTRSRARMVGACKSRPQLSRARGSSRSRSKRTPRCGSSKRRSGPSTFADT